MTVCGYNATMGRGIRVLFEGMYLAVNEKAREENSSFAAVLRRELLEIPGINAALARSQSFELSMFSGLNNMALPLFQHVAATLRSEYLDQASFMRFVDDFIDTLERAEQLSVDTPYRSQAPEDIVERARVVGHKIKELPMRELA